MILLQIVGTVRYQVPHLRNKERFFFKVRGLEIRNLFLDPLKLSDPNFQKCGAAIAHTAESTLSATQSARKWSEPQTWKPKWPLFHKSRFPDLVVHDCKNSRMDPKPASLKKYRLENSPWECEYRGLRFAFFFSPRWLMKTFQDTKGKN